MTRTQCSHTDVAFFSSACDDTICFSDRPEFDLVFTPASKKDSVNHPDHYNEGGIETIDAIEAQLSKEEFEGYLRGNCVKYLWRWKHKGGVEDLKKCKWYLERLISLAE